jgi:hypothetical protein
MPMLAQHAGRYFHAPQMVWLRLEPGRGTAAKRGLVDSGREIFGLPCQTDGLLVIGGELKCVSNVPGERAVRAQTKSRRL